MNLEKVKSFLEEKGHQVYYVAVYGSQNYNLDTTESDFDYKAIIIPTLEQLIQETKPFSSTYEFEGGQVDVKDIRVYIDSAVKCNINFIEILNTPFYLGGTELRKYFLPLQHELGSLYLKACYGMILEKQQALRHPYPSIISKIEKFGYDPKQFHHIVRLSILMHRYITGDIGNYLHFTEELDYLRKIKKGGFQNSEIDIMVEESILMARNIRDGYTKHLVLDAKYAMIAEGRKIIKRYIVNEIKGQN